MKNTSIILIAIVLILVLGGGQSLRNGIDLSGLTDWFTDGNGVDDGKVLVNKPLTLVLMNKFAGSVIATKTVTMYDSTSTPLESVTIGAGGTGDTALPYESGTVLYFRYEDSNDKVWWKETVPKQNPQDAEALTTNTLRLDAFAIGTYSSPTLIHGATSISDDGEYNFTTHGNIQSFALSLANSGSDNTGLISSYDPIYSMQWSPVIYVTFSGTGYETVLVYDFDYDYTLGTTHYVASVADPYALTLHKKGNQILSAGTWDMSFTLDGTGYSGSGCTMQIYGYMYSDPNYAMNHGGSYGPEYVELCEITVTLKTA